MAARQGTPVAGCAVAVITCVVCGRRAFLICALCADCEPALHAAYARMGAITDSLMRRFEFATGTSPMSHWADFEAFVDNQPEIDDYDAAIGIYGARLTAANERVCGMGALCA